MERPPIGRMVAIGVAIAVMVGFMASAVMPHFMEPMFIDQPPVVDLLHLISLIGFAVGLVWLRRISGLDEDPGPTIFRYRDEGAARRHRAAQRDLAGGLELPSSIRRRMTLRWLITRFELGIAVASDCSSCRPMALAGILVCASGRCDSHDPLPPLGARSTSCTTRGE